MVNEELAQIFDTFAHIHEIRGAKNDFFRVRSYNKVSEILRNLPKDISEYVDLEEEHMKEKIPGIGDAIEHKIVEYLKTQEVKELDELKKEIPNGLLDMLEIKNLGPKKVKKFYKELEIDSLEKLKIGLQDGSIENLKGMGQKSVAKILESLEHHEEYSKRTPLGVIYRDLQDIKEVMQSHPKTIRVDIAGSARRAKETIGDIDLLVSCGSADRQEVLKFFEDQKFLKQIEVSGDTKITARLHSGVQIDLRVVDEDEFGAALQYFTGSKNHNVALRTIAKKENYKVNEYGIYKLENDSEVKVGGKNESDIYDILGMQFVPPEIRQGNREIDLALDGKIPQLVELEDIKGELHCHSTYSDGKNSIEEMAKKAIELGYEYIAITDHSPNLAVANGLDESALKKKQQEIKEVSHKLNFPIMFGTEVDILADGSIDYSDSILKEFDFVIASIHVGLENKFQERIMSAIRNPHVNMIGHPTTRLIGKRKGNDLDWKEIFKACVKHNTFLEINAQPLRLDTPYQMVYEGIHEYGLKFAITTDAHNCDGLELMQMGVNYAKRGWVKKKDVLNALSYKEFINAIKK
jgi:DNA polymerase (family 10)